jgi:hypothetical protein
MARSPSAYFTRNGRGRIRYWWHGPGYTWKASLSTCSGAPLIVSETRSTKKAARENLDQKLLSIAQKIERCKTDIGLKRFLRTLGLVVVRTKNRWGILHRDTLRIHDSFIRNRINWEIVLTRHPLESVRRYARGILAGIK